MVYYPLKDIEPQQSVGTHGVGVYPILVVCWAWYLAQECPRCWICQSVGDKSHTGFGVLWGSSNEDQQKQPNEGRKRTDTPHSYCLHIGPTPVPAFPMTRCSPTPSHSKADIAEEKHQSSVAQRRQMEERFWKGLQSILSLVHLGLIFSPKMAILCNSYRESHDTASKFLGYPILRQIHLRKTNYTFNCFHKPRSLRRFTAPETEKSSWRARNDRFARRWRSGVAWFLIPFWLLSCPIFLRVKNVFFFQCWNPNVCWSASPFFLWKICWSLVTAILAAVDRNARWPSSRFRRRWPRLGQAFSTKWGISSFYGHFHKEHCNSPPDFRVAYLIFTFVLRVMPPLDFFSREIVLDPREGDVYGDYVLKNPVVCWDDPWTIMTQ